jgi:uncharacterized protein (TIGR02231 family)
MTLSFFLIWLLAGLQNVTSDPSQTDSEITAAPPVETVTLYLQGAQLTHSSSIDIPEGRHTLIFTGLNAELNAANTTIGFSGNVEIVSVNHRTNSRRQTDDSGEIERLEQEKSMLEQNIRLVQIEQEVISYEMEMLTVNREPDVQNESSLRGLLTLHRERIRELKTETAQFSDSLQTLRSRLNEVNRKLQQPEYRPFVTEGELVVEVNNLSAVTSDVQISYPVRSAGWTPEYEIRAQSAEVPLSGKLSAVVVNNTMQEWQNIDLILSTRTPQRGTDTPVLEPWFLDFITNERETMLRGQNSISLEEVVVTGYAQSDDLMAASPPQSSRSESMVARQFELRDKQTLPSNGETNRITLEEFQIPSEFAYLAIPKLREGALLKADITDWEEYFLLPGSAMLHLEGTFVGQTYIYPQTVSDTLEVSFGRDNGIVVTREKVAENSERSFFRNRVTQTIAHEITVRNTKGYPIEIEVLDQIPVSIRDQIEVSATELSGGDLNSETGMVTWNLHIPPSASESLELVYEVRYPSGQNIRLE